MVTNIDLKNWESYASVGRAPEAYSSRPVCVCVCVCVCLSVCLSRASSSATAKKVSARNFNIGLTLQYLQPLFCKF